MMKNDTDLSFERTFVKPLNPGLRISYKKVERRTVMNDHIKIIGILWIVFGALSLVAAGFLFLILVGVSFIPDIDPQAPGILRFIGFFLGSFLALIGLPKIIGGYGLLKGYEWGRILTLVVSFLSLFNVPFGTALGIYSIIILLNKETASRFQKSAPPDVHP